NHIQNQLIYINIYLQMDFFGYKSAFQVYLFQYNIIIQKKDHTKSQLKLLKMRIFNLVLLLLVVFSVVSASKSHRKLRSKSELTPCNSQFDCQQYQRCVRSNSGIKFCINGF
ncbi:transmembrane protein, putative, partial (macronuclear) [Tetrahymena thermophila SB210]